MTRGITPNGGLSHHRRRGDLREEGLDEFEGMLASPEFAEHYEDAGLRARVMRELVGVRKACQRTQEQVAALMGKRQSTVSEFEGGATDPRLSTLQRYARAVGARIDVRVITEAHAIPLTEIIGLPMVLPAPLQKPVDFESAPELSRAS